MKLRLKNITPLNDLHLHDAVYSKRINRIYDLNIDNIQIGQKLVSVYCDCLGDRAGNTIFSEVVSYNRFVNEKSKTILILKTKNSIYEFEQVKMYEEY